MDGIMGQSYTVAKALPTDRILTNAQVVLPDQVIKRGTVTVEAGCIAAITEGVSSAEGAIDLQGDLLIPGLIDLHTDNLEKHLVPRPGVIWDGISAALSHDAQIIGAGITTVFDALSLVGGRERSDRKETVGPMVAGLDQARAMGLLRADHLIHLRCELTESSLLELAKPHFRNPALRFLSVMDHSPGQRQYRDVEKWRLAYRKMNGLDDDQIEELLKARLAAQKSHAPAHQVAITRMGQDLGVPVASHDDETPDHIEEAVRLGISITEFPVTKAAAIAARDRGMTIMMGAPNMVRGGSHSGNIAAADMAQLGLLDIFASDYVPASLLTAALLLTEPPHNWSLPSAISTVTANAADAAVLGDRGRIQPGLRADLVRIAWQEGLSPVARMVWREGQRVL